MIEHQVVASYRHSGQKAAPCYIRRNEFAGLIAARM